MSRGIKYNLKEVPSGQHWMAMVVIVLSAGLNLLM